MAGLLQWKWHFNLQRNDEGVRIKSVAAFFLFVSAFNRMCLFSLCILNIIFWQRDRMHRIYFPIPWLFVFFTVIILVVNVRETLEGINLTVGSIVNVAEAQWSHVGLIGLAPLQCSFPWPHTRCRVALEPTVVLQECGLLSGLKGC